MATHMFAFFSEKGHQRNYFGDLSFFGGDPSFLFSNPLRWMLFWREKGGNIRVKNYKGVFQVYSSFFEFFATNLKMERKKN